MEERRRHQRFHLSVPITYRVQIPESPEECWMGYGVLKNISFSGVYFSSANNPPIEQGHIRDFTITSAERDLDFSKIAYIRAKSRVVRVEAPQTGSHDLGIALEFFSGPVLNDPRKYK